MNIAGRWVPLEVANTIFLFWAMAVAALGVIVWWLSRRRAPKRSDKEAITQRRRSNRRKR